MFYNGEERHYTAEEFSRLLNTGNPYESAAPPLQPMPDRLLKPEAAPAAAPVPEEVAHMLPEECDVVTCRSVPALPPRPSAGSPRGPPRRSSR